ncbi:MAG: DNA primase [Parachlamydiales bacterium]|jgi:DNA primase
MRTFTKESLELLRQRIDLAEVVSGYVDLKRAGSSYKGLCPFHEEKTPSFVIQSGDTHYHCFGCGAHGDAVEFLMVSQRFSFVEAIEALAEKFGVHLEWTDAKEVYKGPNKALLKAALEKTALFCHYYLLHTPEGHFALNYLYERGMDLEFLQTFQIGLAPKNPFLLTRALKAEDVDGQVLEEAGLSKALSQGRPLAFFQERIMIPIRDALGSIVGFSARKFQEETFGPKYINTPETALFKKSKVLFGLSYSRRRIAKERRAIIVEGQFDALRLIFEGFSITVAGQGTAFTESHMRELLQLGVKRVYLALDPDKAGEEAAIKIGDLFQKEGVEVLVVEFPLGKDPDRFLKEEGSAEFNRLLVQSLDFLSFLVKSYSKSIDQSSPSGKNELVKLLVKKIHAWEQPVLVEESLKRLADLTRVSEETIASLHSPSPMLKTALLMPQGMVDADKILEGDLLRWLFLVADSGPRFGLIAGRNLTLESFKNPICRKFYSHYLEAIEKKASLDLLSLAVDLDDSAEQAFIFDLFQKKINREKAEELFLESIQKILERNWLQKREEIRLKIQSGALEEAEVLKLAKEFDELKNQKPSVGFPE